MSTARRLLRWLLLSCCLVTYACKGAQCPLDGNAATPMPAWVNSPSGETAQDVFAVGVASAAGKTLQEAISAARLNANAELASGIRVSVSSSLRQTASKVTQDQRSTLSVAFESVTESATNLTLRAVRNDAQWLDTKACQVWVRASVDKKEAERAQALETSTRLAADVDAQLRIADDEKLPLSARQAALAGASAMAKLVQPALVPSFSAEVAAMRIEAARSAQAKLAQRQDAYGSALRQHLASQAQAEGETSAVKKKILNAEALRALQEMQGIAPAGIAGLPLPFDPAQRAQALYLSLGLPCLAETQVSNKCAAHQLAIEKRRLYLIGRPVRISCELKLDGSNKPWLKACALAKEFLAGEGALVAPAEQPNTRQAIQMKIDGRGTIRQQRDPDTASVMYRFEGDVQASLDGPDGINLADAYHGITGWNPVSGEMTADILALNVIKRIDEKLAKLWEK